MRFFIVATLAVLVSVSARAMDFVPIQERAQGQSLGGANLLNDTIFSNPASSVFTNVYSIEASMNLPKDLAVSILDTRTADFGGGIGYFRKTRPGFDESLQGARVNLASKLGETFGVGATGKMTWGSTGSGVSEKAYDFDLGVLQTFGWLQIGGSAQNLLGGNDALKLERSWALGARVNYQDTVFFSVTQHSRWQFFRPYQLGAGAEYVSPYYFSLKGGYRFQFDSPFSAWSAGISFLSPRVSLHYAVEFPNDATLKIEHQIALTLLM